LWWGDGGGGGGKDIAGPTDFEKIFSKPQKHLNETN